MKSKTWILSAEPTGEVDNIKVFDWKMNYKLLLPDHFFIHSYLPLNYATWCFVAHGKKYFWKEMIIKEKVYISFPSSLYRERGRGKLVKFPTRTRWELIVVGLVVKLTLTSLHRGGGQSRTDNNTTRNKSGRSQIDYSPPLHSE